MPAIDRRLIQNFEWPLFSLVLLLSLIGVVNLISAAPASDAWLPATVQRQIYWIGLGLLALITTLLPNYRVLQVQ